MRSNSTLRGCFVAETACGRLVGAASIDRSGKQGAERKRKRMADSCFSVMCFILFHRTHAHVYGHTRVYELTHVYDHIDTHIPLYPHCHVKMLFQNF